MAVREVKKQVKNITEQEMPMSLCKRLKMLRFSSDKMSEKELQQGKHQIEVLLVRLQDDQYTNVQDNLEMTKILYLLCDNLQHAYEDGDSLSAHYSLAALTYGIMDIHNPIWADRQDRQDEMQKWRRKKMDAYIKVIETSQAVFECAGSVHANTKKLEKDAENLKQKLREIQVFSEQPENQGLSEKLKTLNGRMNKLRGNELELAGMMKHAVHIFRQCELLKKQIALAKIDMQNYQTLISQIEITLNQPNEFAKREILKYTQELGAELIERVNTQVNDLVKTDAMLDDYLKSMEATFKQPEMDRYWLDTLHVFEELTKTEETLALEEIPEEDWDYDPYRKTKTYTDVNYDIYSYT